MHKPEARQPAASGASWFSISVNVDVILHDWSLRNLCCRPSRGSVTSWQEINSIGIPLCLGSVPAARQAFLVKERERSVTETKIE